MHIRGVSDGYGVEVTKKGQLEVHAVTSTHPHAISHKDGQSYQVSGEVSWGNSTKAILHIKNTHATRNLTVQYIRIQTVGSDVTFPSVNDYFKLITGDTRTGNGVEVTPVNMNEGIGHAARAECYDSNPTMTGGGGEFDRYYPVVDGDKETYNKEGALILTPNKTMTIYAVSSTAAAGIAHARVSFYYDHEPK